MTEYYLGQNEGDATASTGELGEKCAVFGVYGAGLDAARISFFGLYALQHRGQESAGIATSDGDRLTVRKGMGLVSQIFNEESVKNLLGHVAVGHNRYSTTGGSKLKHAQPMLAKGKADLEKIYDEGTPGDIAEWFMNHCKGYIGMLDAQTCVEILTEVDDETMEKNGG